MEDYLDKLKINNSQQKLYLADKPLISNNKQGDFLERNLNNNSKLVDYSEQVQQEQHNKQQEMLGANLGKTLLNLKTKALEYSIKLILNNSHNNKHKVDYLAHNHNKQDYLVLNRTNKQVVGGSIKAVLKDNNNNHNKHGVALDNNNNNNRLRRLDLALWIKILLN